MQPNSWTISRRRKIHLNNVEKNDLKFWKILLIYYIKTKLKNEGKIGNKPAANLIFAR